MAFVKKHLVSLILAVIAIAAIVLSFWPLGSFYETVQGTLTNAQARWSKAQQLVQKPREMPVITPNQKKEPLVGFPTPRLIESVLKAQQELTSQSREILADAAVENMQEFLPVGHKLEVKELSTFVPSDLPMLQKTMLITPTALPEPDANAPFNFKNDLDKEYQKLRATVLQGGVPPAQAEIDKAIVALWNVKKLDLQIVNGTAINQADVEADFNKSRALIPDQLRFKAAQSIHMYLDPSVFQMDASLKTGTLSKEQIWFAHVALWLQEDIARALRETNDITLPTTMLNGAKTDRPAQNVMESPVKRLVRLDIPVGSAIYQRNTGGTMGAGMGAGGMMSRGMAPGAAMGGGLVAVDAISGANEPPKPVLSLSPTGRSCNNVYDVVQFTMVVDVDARAAQMLLNQLSRGRLVSVRKVDISRLDLTPAVNLGFFYGPAPVVQLSLDCEALMLREWTVPLMPKGGQGRTSIREMFGIPDNYTPMLTPPPPAEKKPDQTALN